MRTPRPTGFGDDTRCASVRDTGLGRTFGRFDRVTLTVAGRDESPRLSALRLNGCWGMGIGYG